MVPKCLSRSIIVLPILILAMSLAACGGGEDNLFSDQGPGSWAYRLFSWEPRPENNQAGQLHPGTYAVDPIFIDFYQALGGEDVLGPPISPSRRSDGQTIQYTEASLLVFDPLKPTSTRFRLAPLGVTLGVTEENTPENIEGEGRVINGYLVPNEILAAYESLGGARFVGQPISGATFKPEKQRIEQYFENLGFYQLQGKSKVHLIPYGAYACDRNCRAQDKLAGIPARQPILPAPFLQKALELGLPFIGKPLTGLHVAADGMQEVIFENLVLAADSGKPEEVSVRPIAQKIAKSSQVFARPEESSLNKFIEVEDGLGYNVPLHFISYLEQYGGMEVAGSPISEVFSPEPGVFWQCFTNLCLEFNLNVQGSQRLRPVPLGEQYKTESYEQIRDFTASQEIERIDIRVWEKNAYVPSSGSQEIRTAIYDEGTPLENFEPLLIATMPDGSQRKAYFPPSDENGCSAIKLAPINAPNGTLIAYRVCLFGMDEQENCVGDNYLIWDAD